MRIKTIFQLSVFILLSALTAILTHNHLIPQDVAPARMQEDPRAFSKPFHEITGFHYTGTKNNRRILSIQADRFRVLKLKMGLVRFGLMKELVFDNAKIDVYKLSEQNLSFQILEDSKDISGLIPRSTGKVIFSPIILRVLSQEGEPLSTISAESAIFDLKKRQMVFDRNAEIHSGNRTLNAASLAVISKKGRVIARQGVVLKLPGGTIISDTLHTDIFLTVDRGIEKGAL